jgi:transposase
MADGYLFDADGGPLSDGSTSKRRSVEPELKGKPRVVRADRRQMRLESRCLDDAIPENHRARTLWEATASMDLSGFYAEIRSVEAVAGRPAIDPRVLLALWLYATAEGVGSARQLSRLCCEHDAYRWIAGGLEICHRVLSAFRVNHGAKLDQILTELLAALVRAEVVTMRVVAQDGTRVRASAGASSFRRRRSLRQCQLAARRQVSRLKKCVNDEEDATTDRRKRAAAEKAAKQRLAKVEKALAELGAVEESKLKNGKKGEARTSTTDPEARVMKMADGGYRPAFNCQLATDTDSRIVVGVRVSNSGGDMGQTEATVEEIRARTGRSPGSYLVDGGYAKKESIVALEREGIPVYVPPAKNPKTRDPNKRQRVIPPEVTACRERMQTDEAKKLYKLRASTIETINGDLKTYRGLGQFGVRGIDKATSVLLLSVLTYNLLRTIAIAPQVLIPA